MYKIFFLNRKKYQQTQQNLKTKLIFKELNNITNMIVNDFPTMTVKLDNVMKKIKENSKNSSKQKKFRYTFKITSSRIVNFIFLILFFKQSF